MTIIQSLTQPQIENSQLWVSGNRIYPTQDAFNQHRQTNQIIMFERNDIHDALYERVPKLFDIIENGDVQSIMNSYKADIVAGMYQLNPLFTEQYANEALRIVHQNFLHAIHLALRGYVQTGTLTYPNNVHPCYDESTNEDKNICIKPSKTAFIDMCDQLSYTKSLMPFATPVAALYNQIFVELFA